MMGHTHSLSGFAVASATLPVAPVHGAAAQISWVAVWGGMAMLPDLDQPGSTSARMWGPVTSLAAHAVGAAFGGHRKGTHDFVVAPLAFGAVALLAAQRPWASMLVLALAIGLALRACAFVIPGRTESTVIGNLALSWIGAWLLTRHGAPSPAWLPIAVAGGTLVHIAGDALTDHGVPVPFTWLSGSRHTVELGLFRTGAAIETVGFALAFSAVTAWQLYEHTGAGLLLRPAVTALRATT